MLPGSRSFICLFSLQEARALIAQEKSESDVKILGGLERRIDDSIKQNFPNGVFVVRLPSFATAGRFLHLLFLHCLGSETGHAIAQGRSDLRLQE